MAFSWAAARNMMARFFLLGFISMLYDSRLNMFGGKRRLAHL